MSNQATKTFSQMLIERGIKPGNKKYAKVRPKGVYMLFPSMWRKAKLLEQVNDWSYEQLMNQYEIAQTKHYLNQKEKRSNG